MKQENAAGTLARKDEESVSSQPPFREGSPLFSIYKPEDDNWYSGKTRVVDMERGISLEFKNGIVHVPGGVFVLTHGAMQIPFHTRQRGGLVDEVSGRPYFVTEIAGFGTSFYLRPEDKLPNPVFESQEEVLEWERIAAEALLIYGLHYDGLKFDPDYTRVLLNGRLLTRRDFGYS